MEPELNPSKEAHSPRSSLGLEFIAMDIGAPELPGSAHRVGTGWDIVAGGADIWGKTDQCHFVCQRAAGDFDLAVRVESFRGAHLYSKAGLMIRESFDADSPHVMFLVFADNSARNNNLGACEMQFRAKRGDECQAIYPAVKPPAPPEFPAAYPNFWLRVQRLGTRFSAFACADGKTWKQYGTQTVPLPDVVHVGLAVTSHEPQATAQARFREYGPVKKGA